jgi:hypothetical protein
MNPKHIPSGNDILNISIENNPHAIASESPGMTVNRLAIHPIERNASKSNSNPLRIKITLKPAARMSLDHRSGKSFTRPPGTFLSSNPHNNIPVNDGSPHITAAAPPTCAHAQISATAQTPPPLNSTFAPFGAITSPNANRSIAHIAHAMTQNDNRS